jgi:D-psicose/D-tagatose/L-ribulose 3-epimerase
MRFGVNTWVWVSPLTDADVMRLVPHVAAMGFDWIEFPIEFPDGFDYARAGALAREYGLGVSVAAVISPDRDLIHPDESIRVNGAAYVRHCIDAAHTMGAPILIGPLYSAVGRTWQMTTGERDRDTRVLVDQLYHLASYASELGVTLAIEPLNRFETSFINLSSQAMAIVDQVAHPSCQIMLDTFHMNIEETSLGDAIRSAGSRLRHVHASENDRGTPGAGHIPWQEVAAGLRDIGYNNAIVIESFANSVKTIARAAAIWRPLARSQDALAQEGLVFLRGLLT